MTICIADIYRNEEGKWLVFGVKHPDEKPMVLLIKKGQKSKEEPIVIREIEPWRLVEDYALDKAYDKPDCVVAWRRL